ncbi:MAG TPA: transcriptional regulator [Firmicutes bacterium]|nr:transcriptional regulator [Bacillota bacterium]
MGKRTELAKRNLVKMHRARLDMTQEELAQAVGVSRQTIHAVERGKADPSLSLALKLAALFEVAVDDLFSLADG